MLPQRPRPRPRPAPRAPLLCVEALEPRTLLTSSPVLLLPAEDAANDTLDSAADLGELAPAAEVRATGAVGDNPAAEADVDFFRFALAAPTRVRLAVQADGGDVPLQSVLSLYAPAPSLLSLDRLLAQDDGATHGGDAVLELSLGAGTYAVAVSGAGNRFFHPRLADSGLTGSTGAYTLTVTTTDLGLVAGDGPVVLSSDPAEASALSRSPLALRLRTSAPLSPDTLFPDQTVVLTYSRTGVFDDTDDTQEPVALAQVAFLDDTGELLVVPVAPLKPGFYRLFLAGNRDAHLDVVTGLDGTALGQSAAGPAGRDFAVTFQVAGSEGTASDEPLADDTADTAHALDVTPGTIVQVTGAIGDDPSDYFPFNPSDVDLYHFQVAGAGSYALLAEVFAGRVGSPLNPALSLFRYDEASPGSPFVFLASNDASLNGTRAEDGSAPLEQDAVLFAGLTAGNHYYLAVSSAFNYPNATTPPGELGVFDPRFSHSGFAGGSTGEYVLNLLLVQDADPPSVVSASIDPGEVLGGPPTTIAVHFDERVNLRQLALDAFLAGTDGALPPVFAVGSDGQRYALRLQSYDEDAGRATFVALRALPPGAAELHLAGQPAAGGPGMTDFAGNPLVGNQPGDPAGDFVIPFEVGGAPRGSEESSSLWLAQQTGDSLDDPQVIGPLFPLELFEGVAIERRAAGGEPPADTEDVFLIEVLAFDRFLFNVVSETGLPAEALPEVTDLDGNIYFSEVTGARANNPFLQPGVYRVRLGGWDAAAAPGVTYRLEISTQGTGESATPLTTGPAPALRIRLTGAPQGPPPPPRVDVPPEAVLPPVPIRPLAGFGREVFVTTPASPFAGLPTGILLGLGAGPVGGVRGDRTAVVERVRLGPEGPGLLDEAARLALLAGVLVPGDFPGDEAVPGEEAQGSPAAEALRRLAGAARPGLEALASGPGSLLRFGTGLAGQGADSMKALDRLFSGWGPKAPPTVALPAPDPVAPPEPQAARTDAAPVVASADSASAVEKPPPWWSTTAGRGWAVAAGLAGMLAFVTGRRRLGRRGGSQRLLRVVSGGARKHHEPD